MILHEADPSPAVALIEANVAAVLDNYAAAKKLHPEPAIVILDPRMTAAYLWASMEPQPPRHDLRARCLVLGCDDDRIAFRVRQVLGEPYALAARAKLAHFRQKARERGEDLVVTLTGGTIAFNVCSIRPGPSPAVARADMN